MVKYNILIIKWSVIIKLVNYRFKFNFISSFHCSVRSRLRGPSELVQKIFLILREQIEVADAMAKLKNGDDTGIKIYHSPPPSIQRFLRKDELSILGPGTIVRAT